MTRFISHIITFFAGLATCLADPPKNLNPQLEYLQSGVRLTLVAEHPRIVTPTGIDVDGSGKIWAVASHTHFRPQDYDGPPNDEILVFGDDNSRHVFYAKTEATMDLELGGEGWVYLAERDRVLRVRDTDGDGRGDLEEDIAILDTEATYPHNGLSGLAWHPSGDLIFSLGENYSESWTLSGKDGPALTGTGEGGVFRCRADGTSLRRIARGFWNPFGVCVRDDGTIFAAENDPGARPPCRLLHVVPGGDYGYQRLYGNSPFHPFVCWNGQLRGTLPMLHPLGEAPCGIAPLAAGLIVPSWTDHRIDFYPLRPRGASFTTDRIPLVRGGDHFRPTCITQQSPTIFYLTDWVYGSYQLHGRGRIWRLEIDPSAATWLGSMDIAPPHNDAKMADQLRRGGDAYSDQRLFELARSKDAFVARAAIDALSIRTASFTEQSADELTKEDRISLLLALRKSAPKSTAWVKYFLAQADADIRFEALRWVADEQLKQFRSDVQAMLDQADTPYLLYEACLATSNALSGNPGLGIADAEMLIARLTDSKAPVLTRAFALRLLDPSHKRFSPDLWRRLYDTHDPLLVSELTRALAFKGTSRAKAFLLRVAEDQRLEAATRGDALAGLAGSTGATLQRLIQFAQSSEPALREEALRSLRFSKLDKGQQEQLQQVADSFPQSADLVRAVIDPTSLSRSRPEVSDIASWRERLAAVQQPVDLLAGRRIFFHAGVGTCAKCHRHRGRGSSVGPDLSAVSSAGDPDRLLRALLQPSREVDPQYFPRMLVTEDGHIFTGIMLRDGGGGKEFYRDNNGRERMFLTSQIAHRKELETSLMPEGLADGMTDREIRDLLAFLDSRDADSTSGVPQSRFVGSYWLDFPDGYGGWLAVDAGAEGLRAELLWRVGSPKPMARVAIENGKLVMQRRRGKETSRFVASVSGDEIKVEREGTSESARGRRCPPLPARPDLANIQFGDAIDLFNGRDLSGWQLQPPGAINGWSVQRGQLVNETPKQDFSSYGAYGNLRTKELFGDCKLHVEFNVGSRRNSGIYVRGLYEAQVVDRDSPMQGINGPGAIFGRIAPTSNAGLPGGQWQTYDITLVDRHITVVLNGKLVIDNLPVKGCTGGALFGDVTRRGPVYLQGDHTSIRYRNIRLWPRK